MSDEPANDAVAMPKPIPPWVQVPRLEAILGGPASDLTWERLQDLVRRQVPEDVVLEYKSELYGRAERDKQELCKDAAAFANGGGGLIVIGIAEDLQGRAATLRPLADLEQESRRMAEVLIGGLAPWVSNLAIWTCDDPEGDQTGALLVLIPPSDDAPHAVRRGNAYAWPVRQDRMTRWMREPELASRYRDRFRGAEEAARRSDRVAQDGLRRLDRRDICWLALVLTPMRPGRLRADRDAYKGWLGTEMTGLPIGIPVQAAVLGRRRIVFTDQYMFRGMSRDHHVELHEDGSGFAAVAINERRDIADLSRLDLPEHQTFDVDSVIQWTVGYLRMLAAHAVNANSGGDFIVNARLVPGLGQHDEVSAQSSMSLVPSEPFTDSNGSYFGQRIVPGSMPVVDPSALEVATTPSIASSAGDLISVASEITRELLAEFASIPTEQVLSDDGYILNRRPAGALASLISWAQHRGVLADR